MSEFPKSQSRTTTQTAFSKKKAEEHDFLGQIKKANLSDEDKGALCSYLVDALIPDNAVTYLLGLIHLEWRGFKQLCEATIDKQELLSKLDELRVILVENDCDMITDGTAIIKIMKWYNKTKKELERLER